MSESSRLSCKESDGIPVKRLRLSLKSHRNRIINRVDIFPNESESKGKLNLINDSSVLNGAKTQECPVIPEDKEAKLNSGQLNEVSVYITSLKNLGNTCYLNSVIYCLLYIKEFRKIIHEAFVKLQLTHSECKSQFRMQTRSVDVVLRLHEIFQQMIQIKTDAYTDVEPKSIAFHCSILEPIKLLEALRSKNSMFEGHFENDAHDVLSCIMQCLEVVDNCKLQWKKPKSRSSQLQTVEPLSDMFQGELLMKTKCLECECWSTTKEKFTEVSIASTCSNLDFENALKMEEMLRGNEKYWCDKCHQRNEAVRVCEYLKFPPVLTINMKPCYMQYNSPNEFYKALTHTAVPEEISCLNNTCLSKPCTNASHKFILLALICHIGSSLSSGHFTCYIKGSVMYDKVDTSVEDITGHTDKKMMTRNVARKNRIIEKLNFECCDPPEGPKIKNEWVYFDDEFVKMVPELPKFGEGIRTETPYLLFYRNMDGR